jgi:hypothetical protein
MQILLGVGLTEQLKVPTQNVLNKNGINVLQCSASIQFKTILVVKSIGHCEQQQKQSRKIRVPWNNNAKWHSFDWYMQLPSVTFLPPW